MSGTSRGRAVVLTIYVVSVSLAGIVGFIIGLIRPEALQPVPLLGLFWVDPTPLGLAVYGIVNVGTVMAVGIGLVMLASRYADPA